MGKRGIERQRKMNVNSFKSWTTNNNISTINFMKIPNDRESMRVCASDQVPQKEYEGDDLMKGMSLYMVNLNCVKSITVTANMIR